MNSLVRELLSKNANAITEKSISEDDTELTELLKTLKTSIKIVGCGGSGSNTITRIFDSNIKDVELIAANTDAQHLLITRSQKKILLGRHVTRGLGAGALPEVGEEAIKETEEDMRKAVTGADIVFVTAGMGGGTGTGSAPIVSKIAKEEGALVIAVTTLPFSAEGRMRMDNALMGIEKLKANADTTIVIPNDKLLRLVPRLPLNAAFRVADEVLLRAIKGITDMVTKPGLVNLDFNDLRAIMKNGGIAMIGLGESESDNRAEEALNEALNSPLLDIDISGATGALIDVVGSDNMTIEEAEKVVSKVSARLSPQAKVIWGSSVKVELGNTLSVMLVVTGIKSGRSLEKAKGKVNVIK
jgi:cell division protein FtsZ